jgi:formylglycine-generating enzyme required for sulfatase activity
MVLIPGGLFRLGYDGGDANAAPAHTVELDPYYIDVFEVTVGRYAEFVKGGRSAGRVSSPAINADQAAEFPALGVSWGDALRYSEWVGKSLPTEAQWELAGRGPNSFEHPWGYGRPAWPQPRVHGEIRAVGSSDRDRSLFGVYDMAGNAREWVADYFSDAAYRRSTAGEAAVVRNPTGPRRPSISNHRVVKGGSPEWDLWHRGSASIGDPPRDVGFRCVLPLTKGPDGTLTFVRKEATRSGEPTARRP